MAVRKGDDSSQAVEDSDEPQDDISPGLRKAILWETGVDPVELREENRKNGPRPLPR